MKNRLLLSTIIFATLIFLSTSVFAQIDIMGKIGGAINSEVDKKADEAVDDALHPKKKDDQKKDATQNSNSSNADKSTSSAQAIKAYNNYDFHAGDHIIFEDLFRDDQDGEFPAHWNLDAGQAVVNKVQSEPAFCITEGNYALVSPRMKTDSYLTDPFTVEFDYYQAHSNQYAPMIRFFDGEGTSHDLHFGKQVSTSYFPHDLQGSDVADDENYYGKWHHGAMIIKNGQMKVYIDNVRALVMPHTDIVPVKLSVGGIGDQNAPITFRNFRIASGGDQNMIGKMLTDGKFVTHGITFDVGKSTLKPESMGVLNDVVKFMKENSSAKFEIDGHTDSDGDATKNQKLSEDRAASVKAQLTAMGIDGSRLSTKGFGSAKPLGPNDSPEGKANNRRVEFVKM
ncbi:MAG: OmpA family protein [Bacteroidota bacterium]|nr:OmpA family protein [Bacteroidota bacterium]MDP4236995.1 OmpA family protein [Bacteroidota bacterium]